MTSLRPMRNSLPPELLTVLGSATVADYVTVGPAGRPTVWPARCSYDAGHGCIELGGQPGAAQEAAADPHVALLYAQAEPLVLVQGTARPEAERIRVLPERVLSFPTDPEAEPALYDTHLEEVRSGHNEEPEIAHAPPEGGTDTWGAEMDALPSAATLGFVGPDGFPFAVRVTVRPDRAARVVRLGREPVGTPIEPGKACLGAAAIRIHGDLADEGGVWVLHPHQVTGSG
jgi:hypothetical protein